MNEIEFSSIVIERYQNSDDRILNIIIKLIEENNIEIENISHYLTNKVVEILKQESEKFNVLVKDENQEEFFNIF